MGAVQAYSGRGRLAVEATNRPLAGLVLKGPDPTIFPNITSSALPRQLWTHKRPKPVRSPVSPAGAPCSLLYLVGEPLCIQPPPSSCVPKPLVRVTSLVPDGFFWIGPVQKVEGGAETVLVNPAGAVSMQSAGKLHRSYLSHTAAELAP
jgi:hypothetical protein